MTAVELTDERVRVNFHLDGAEDWPPNGVESIWCVRTSQSDEFVVDSIPLFVFDVSLGDTIRAEADSSGQLACGGLVRDGGHSTVRVFVPPDDVDTSEVVALAARVGCGSEVLRAMGIVGMDVPTESALDSLRLALAPYVQLEKLWVEESKLSGL